MNWMDADLHNETLAWIGESIMAWPIFTMSMVSIEQLYFNDNISSARLCFLITVLMFEICYSIYYFRRLAEKRRKAKEISTTVQ